MRSMRMNKVLKDLAENVDFMSLTHISILIPKNISGAMDLIQIDKILKENHEIITHTCEDVGNNRYWRIWFIEAMRKKKKKKKAKKKKKE